LLCCSCWCQRGAAYKSIISRSRSTETGAAGRLKHMGTEAKESRREGCKQTRANTLPPSTPSLENR